MKKVLLIGPSVTRSKGGMSTVIQGIEQSKLLNEEYEIETFSSYIDGNKLTVLVYSLYAFLKFFLFKRNYDVYHIHAASNGSTFRKGLYVYAAKHWGKKVILHIHGAEYMLFYEKSRQKRKIRSIMNKADVVLALSDDWQEKFVRIIGVRNCKVLNNGIDTDVFACCCITPAINRKSFLMLGRQGQRKGSYDLLKAMERAVKLDPEIMLYMAGDGEVDQVRQVVYENGLQNNVQVVGWIDFEGKCDYFRKSSTLVLPSYNEGLPMAILEAMAAGKVIISTNVGAIPEVISPENGVLITPGDVQALADAIIWVSNHPEIVETISTSNLRKVNSQFSVKAVHSKLAEYYEAV